MPGQITPDAVAQRPSNGTGPRQTGQTPTLESCSRIALLSPPTSSSLANRAKTLAALAARFAPSFSVRRRAIANIDDGMAFSLVVTRFPTDALLGCLASVRSGRWEPAPAAVGMT